jgi:hypothetical protein
LGQDPERACKSSDRGAPRLKTFVWVPFGGPEARGTPADGLGEVRTRAPRVPFLRLGFSEVSVTGRIPQKSFFSMEILGHIASVPALVRLDSDDVKLWRGIDRIGM